MPRPLGTQAAGDVYHVTSRGNRKQPIYLEGNDRTFHLWWFDKVAIEADGSGVRPLTRPDQPTP
jgi:hypothetical protein